RQHRRDDLPGDAVLVLQPAARALLPALRQPAPEMIDLRLCRAGNLERDRLVELEMRAAVERGKGLAVDLKLDNHDGTGFLAVHLTARLAVTADVLDARVLEHRDIEIRRLLGLRIEPQARRDLLLGLGHDRRSEERRVGEECRSPWSP